MKSLRLSRQPYPSRKALTHNDLKTTYEDVGNVLNGNIEFGSPTSNNAQNVKGSWATGKSLAEGVEFAVPHSLGKVPTGFHTVSVDQPGILYKGTTPWTSTQIYLKSSTAETNYTIFVL